MDFGSPHSIPSHARDPPFSHAFWTRACVLLSARHGPRKGLACRHLTPDGSTTQREKTRREEEKNWEPPRTDTGRHQPCVVHFHEILQSLSRNCTHHLSDVPRTHAHIQVHALRFIQTVHAFHACLKSVLGRGFAQPRPQASACEALPSSRRFSLASSHPSRIRPHFLICLFFSHSAFSLTHTLYLSSLVIPLMPCHMLAGDTRHPQSLVEIIPAI